MSLASTYPTIINGVTYAPFAQWAVTYNDVKTIHETEAGTQEDVIINTGRRSIAVATTCLQATATTLANLEDLDNFTVKFYDIKTNAYKESTMRVTPGSMSVSRRKGSAKTASGVWDVTFTLEEYA